MLKSIISLKDFFKKARWLSLYIVSLLILPVAFFANHFFAKAFFGFIIRNMFVEENIARDKKFRQKYQKTPIFKKTIFFIIAILIGNLLWAVCQSIYHDFFLGKFGFSINLLLWIVLLQIIIIFTFFANHKHLI